MGTNLIEVTNNYAELRKRQILRRRFETREFIISLKQQPCTDCGGTFHYCQMDFVAKNGNEPFKISNFLNRSRKRIILEINKRDLVCANCGRLRTWNTQRAKRSGPT